MHAWMEREEWVRVKLPSWVALGIILQVWKSLGWSENPGFQTAQICFRKPLEWPIFQTCRLFPQWSHCLHPYPFSRNSRGCCSSNCKHSNYLKIFIKFYCVFIRNQQRQWRENSSCRLGVFFFQLALGRPACGPPLPLMSKTAPPFWMCVHHFEHKPIIFEHEPTVLLS
jgi:hypothetical protein